MHQTDACTKENHRDGTQTEDTQTDRDRQRQRERQRERQGVTT